MADTTATAPGATHIRRMTRSRNTSDLVVAMENVPADTKTVMAQNDHVVGPVMTTTREDIVPMDATTEIVIGMKVERRGQVASSDLLRGMLTERLPARRR